MEELINSIMQAEQSVDESVKASIQQAKDIILQANLDAEALIKDAEKQARAKYKDYVNKANYTAERQTEETLKDCYKDAEQLDKIAKKNQDEAIALIIKELLEQNV